MQPLGRKPVRFPGKTDCHPPRGHVNWWEVEFNKPNKGGDRQAVKRELERQSRELKALLSQQAIALKLVRRYG